MVLFGSSALTWIYGFLLTFLEFLVFGGMGDGSFKKITSTSSTEMNCPSLRYLIHNYLALLALSFGRWSDLICVCSLLILKFASDFCVGCDLSCVFCFIFFSFSASFEFSWKAIEGGNNKISVRKIFE